MKKILATILALVMIFSMGATAFAAAGTNADTGSITITKAHLGTTYSIYQILTLQSYNTDEKTYIYYPASDEWADWIEDSEGGGKYLKFEKNGTVVWAANDTLAVTVADFAKEALAYAKDNNIEPYATQTAVAGEDGKLKEIKFSPLNLGYWLVDSSAGALCSLDTVMPNTIIEEKNVPIIIDKKVQDSQGIMQEFISSNVGRAETFMSKVTLYYGAENVVYHDIMQDTIDFSGPESVKVYYTPVSKGIEVPEEYYTVVTGDDLKAHEDHNDHNNDGSTKDEITCTFEVVFSDNFLKTITEATDITIVYQGELNKKAIVAGEGNVNDAMVTFGNDGYSKWDDAKLYTYQFGIVKTDASSNILEGAEFDLYYSATGNNQVLLVEETPAYDGFVAVEGAKYYRPATEEEIAKFADDDPETPGHDGSAKIEAGIAFVWGVRDGIAFYLEETKNPDGYNPLAERYHITALQKENNDPQFNTNEDDEIISYVGGGVKVVNLAGTQLPSTGGIGTTIFYVIGGMLFVGALVFLVTKKRMSE